MKTTRKPSKSIVKRPLNKTKPTKVSVKRKRKPSTRTSGKTALSKWGSWQELFVSTGSYSGVTVSNESSMQLSAVFSCIRNISEDVAKVPVKVFQGNEEGKERITEHPLHTILNYQANPEMTAMDFRQTLTAHCLGWGNGYAEIQRNIIDGIVALWPLHPSKVKPERATNGQIYYEFQQDDGSTRNIPLENMLHIKGLGGDGLVGYNVIHYARESLGLAKAAEMFGATYFGNNTVLGGTLSHPNRLSEKAKAGLVKSIKDKHQGADKAHNVMILEEGMKWEKTVIPPEESQFLETRQFTVPEICRWFRMPPHKVADLTRATFSNIEHQDIEYVKDCLMAWFKRWEVGIWWKLLNDSEKKRGLYIEHTVEGLLRGDIQSRYAAYQVSLGNNNNPGFMTINEVRALENLNPVDGGDELFSPQEPETPAPQEAIPDEPIQSDN